MFPPDQLGALMGASDYVVMALPHTPATDKLVGPDALAALRPHAVLVNIGRGKTLDEDALVEGAGQYSRFRVLEQHRWRSWPVASARAKLGEDALVRVRLGCRFGDVGVRLQVVSASRAGQCQAREDA